FAANLRRALRTLGGSLPQVLLVGGPAGDDELLGVLLRSLPADVPVGRGSVGGTLDGPPAGHRYAAAVGLGLARPAPAAGAAPQQARRGTAPQQARPGTPRRRARPLKWSGNSRSFTSTLKVDTSKDSFVRTQVFDSSGTLIGLSNPVWLLRKAPPGGIRAP